MAVNREEVIARYLELWERAMKSNDSERVKQQKLINSMMAHFTTEELQIIQASIKVMESHPF